MDVANAGGAAVTVAVIGAFVVAGGKVRKDENRMAC